MIVIDMPHVGHVQDTASPLYLAEAGGSLMRAQRADPARDRS